MELVEYSAQSFGGVQCVSRCAADSSRRSRKTVRCRRKLFPELGRQEMNAQIHHVNVTVPKSLEDAAKHFYGVVMGLQEVPKPESSRGRGGAWYQLGPLQLHL